MKTKHPRTGVALVLTFTAMAHAPSLAERLPGLVMDPLLYQQRVESGNPNTPGEPPRPPVLLKMSSHLAALYEPALRPSLVSEAMWKMEMQRLGQIQSAAGVAQNTPYGPVDSDLLHVYVNLTEAAALDAVRPLCFGTPDEAPDWLLMAAWIEQDRLQNVASLPQVRFIHAVDPPRHRTGSVTTAGDALHNGPQARSIPPGLDGSNIRVGVISNGVTNWPSALASGDLPPTLNAPNLGAGDEGTAMLEIVHDLAPGAALDFLPSGTNKIAFGNAIAALAQGGCNIVCDDVGWYDDPYFEPSPLGMLINNLRTQFSYLHVSAAGNDGTRHHQQVFSDVQPPGSPDGWHDPILFVNIPPGGVLDAFMQWKEALAAPPASDYDLYLYDYNNLSTPIAQSLGRNVVGETIYYTNNTASTITAALFVYRYSGTLVHDLEIFVEPQNGAVEYTNGMSAVDAIFGHPAHGAVIAAVATDVANPSAIEPDSSQGPVTLLGVLPPPPKPDAAAADGVAVTGAGGFGSPFFGTSAAAPHVAGVLALVWSRSPGASSGALKASLPQGCVDLGSPPPGFDSVFGHGRPLADQWAYLLNLAPTITAPVGTIECAQNIAEKISGLVVNDPDAGSNPIVLTLGLSQGSLGQIQVDVMVPGGLMAPEVLGNGSQSVTITATPGSIQNTFASDGGLKYLPSYPVPPGTTVADTLAIQANDQGNSGVGGSLTAAGSVNLRTHQFAYYAWQYDNFDASQLANPAISGDAANPDGDLHANVWEYFMGADPWTQDSESAATGAVSGTDFVYRFRVSKDIQAANYAIKVSQDLVSWADVPGGQITTPWPQHPVAADAWLMEVKRPLSGNTKDFLRIAFDPRK